MDGHLKDIPFCQFFTPSHLIRSPFYLIINIISSHLVLHLMILSSSSPLSLRIFLSVPFSLLFFSLLSYCISCQPLLLTFPIFSLLSYCISCQPLLLTFPIFSLLSYCISCQPLLLNFPIFFPLILLYLLSATSSHFPYSDGQLFHITNLSLSSHTINF